MDGAGARGEGASGILGVAKRTPISWTTRSAIVSMSFDVSLYSIFRRCSGFPSRPN